MTVGGAGGRRDPSRVRVADLTEASYDRLLGGLRKELRKNYGFPRGRSSFGVDCVYSTEPCQFPQSDGSVCAKPDPKVKGLRLNCERGYGTASFVTGTFGFVAAAHVVARLSARGQS